MGAADCLRLCGGTFFILFTRAMKEHGRQKNNLTDSGNAINKQLDEAAITERNALKGLVKIFYPSMGDLARATEKTNATNYKKCHNISSIPFDDASLRDAFDKMVRHNYGLPLKAMAKLVDAQVDAEGKGERFIKSLLELIDKDEYIPEDAQFYVGAAGKPLTKKELRSENRFCLEALALGVWHYCVIHVLDNTVGKDTYYTFYPSAQKSGAGGRHQFVNSIGNNPSRLINLVAITEYYGDGQADLTEQESIPTIDRYYSSYFDSVKTDISAVKTILFEETINFPDFYVSNGIQRSVYRNTDATEGRLPLQRDDNPTIESLKVFGLRIIIRAIGGMGKSMLMRHFMLDGIERYKQTGKVPVYIRLKDYTSLNYEMPIFIYDSIKAYFPSVDQDRVNQDITNGNLVLLLDGLDEISSAYRGQFETKLNRLLAVNDKLQVIVSTRQFSKDIYASDFKFFTLLPLSKSKAMKLVEKLPFRPYDPSKKAAFLKALDERLYQERHVFARNPLLLTFMLMTYERYGGEENSLHSFYAEVYELLATRHDSTKEGYDRVFKAGLRPERLRDIFAAFCAITYEKEELDFNSTEIHDRFREVIDRLPEPECNISPADIVEDVTSGVCMLYRDGERYYFHHRSFQEYFCALCFSKQGEEKLKAIGDFFEQRSHEKGDVALQMLCGIIPEKSEKFILLPFLKELLGNENGSGYWHFMQHAHPYFYYDCGETESYSVNEPGSYLYSYIVNKYQIQEDIGSYEMPFYDELVDTRYVKVELRGSELVVEDGSNLYYEAMEERYGSISDEGFFSDDDSEIVGYTLFVQTEDILSEPERFSKLISTMERADFPFRIEYESARRLMLKMQERAKLNPKKLIDYI